MLRVLVAHPIIFGAVASLAYGAGPRFLMTAADVLPDALLDWCLLGMISGFVRTQDLSYWQETSCWDEDVGK